MNPVIERLTVYPIKSMDGVDVDSAEISPGGALRNDRRFALRNEEGRFINGKKYPLIHKLRASFNEDISTVTFSSAEFASSPVFELAPSNKLLSEWLNDYFSLKVTFIENNESGFPDDLNAYGPTITSISSYEMVKEWFGFKSIDEVHRRFRANIVLTGCTPFWEDILFGSEREEKEFTIGAVTFFGVNPCNRCPVPTRDPDSGEPVREFQKIFSIKRKEYFPPDIDPARFDHYYKFAVNTRIPLSQAGKSLRTGDSVRYNNY